jgi:hypothetical protein
MRLRHDGPVVRASFDDPNLVSCVGLEPVMRLAESCDLPGIVAEKVHLGGSVGSNPAGKVSAIVAGMVAGADSIDDLCDMRVHVVSESVVWRSADDVDGVTSG